VIPDRTGPATAFNARWLTPAEIAERFVPVPAFQKLLAVDHSVLLGPRGSGKTTLLKMLTRPALDAWAKQHGNASASLAGTAPAFEAVYVPSDVRWSIELSAVANDPTVGPDHGALLQRFLVTLSSIQSVAKTFRSLLNDEHRLEDVVLKGIRDLWPLSVPPNTLTHLDLLLRKTAYEVRGHINRRQPSEIAEFVNRLPKEWLGHPLDVPIAYCEVFAALAGERVRGQRWAFCFDELEIAPDWLRKELLRAWRSVDQPYLLKLTWSPVLPKEARGTAATDHDFKPILLWHAHAHEARGFASQVAERFVSGTFGPDSKPEDVFGRSSLPEGGWEEEQPRATKYERGSNEYDDIKALAARDPSFSDVLIKHGISPSDPFTAEPRLRDVLLRKIRPVVALRLAYMREAGGLRSRKAVPEVYSGIEVLYDVCEGNPRWLQNLLSELFNDWASSGRNGESRPSVDAATQARVVRSFAQRFHDELYARPVAELAEVRRLRWSVGDLVDRIATTLAERLFAEQFPVDPVGAFRVDAQQPPEIVSLIVSGLDFGAFVMLGATAGDASFELVGSELRMSYRLAAYYNLLPRRYRAVTLASLLASARDSRQIGLFVEEIDA
jgi:hypothetical protein